MKRISTQSWLSLFLLIVLLFPFIQYPFGIIRSAGLRGAEEKKVNPTLTLKTWWDGSYQQQKALFLNDNVGFRPDLVRLNNQIDFSLFGILHARNVYIGHDNYLFDKDYVEEYEGTAYMGEQVIRNELVKLKLVQDTLEKLGKTFVFTYAPSKPYYVPDKIPDALRPTGGRKTSNYETFCRIADSLHIKQLDFNALFKAMKDTVHGAIITRQGFHWSVYGSMLAADTLVKFIERERKIQMPELAITKMKYTTQAQDADDDFIAFANLMAPIEKETYCYPDYHYTDGPGKTKPKAIYIGDSFVWQLVHYGLMQNTNASWEFWYYFNTSWNADRIASGNGISMDNYDWQKPLLDADCIITVFTPMNLHIFDSKTFFIEKFYDYFYPGKAH